MQIAKRLISSTLIVSCTLLGMPLRAQATIIPTDALIQPEPTPAASDSRASVGAFFARADVQQALAQQGVDPAAAQARVAAMSDAEVEQLAGRVADAPAGGEVLSLLFTVFIVLLVTDILGFTKVYPFTRSIR